MAAARLTASATAIPGAADDALRGRRLRLAARRARAAGRRQRLGQVDAAARPERARARTSTAAASPAWRWWAASIPAACRRPRSAPGRASSSRIPSPARCARTVEREVAFPLENAAVEPAAIPGRIDEALALVGASHLRGRDLAELSGGELQRVALAAALAPRPALLLLDEPTSQLDPDGADALAALLRRLADEQGVTVVVADHRTARLEPVADRALVMRDGAIVPDGPRPRRARRPSPWTSPALRAGRWPRCAASSPATATGRPCWRRPSSSSRRARSPSWPGRTAPARPRSPACLPACTRARRTGRAGGDAT